MSVTISNCTEICNSPTNLSKAKMLYSFPKASRFNDRKTALCDKFYEISKNGEKRATSFGYGNKYDFTSEAPVSPPPNKYNSQSDFKKGAKKGFCFGGSRDQMKCTGPLAETIKNKNPGPGAYNFDSKNLKKGYSIRKKIIKQDMWQKVIPGPGSYEPSPTISKEGFYYVAKYKSSGAHSFSQLPRRDMSTSNVVGPGQYATLDGTNPLGRYVNSKTANIPSRHFGKAKRADLGDDPKTPGPGYYRHPSQFGYYISAKQHEKQKQSVIVVSEDKQNVR